MMNMRVTKLIAMTLCLVMIGCFSLGSAEGNALTESNAMVTYTADSPWIKAITTECAGLTDQKAIYNKIINYYVQNFAYDFVKWTVSGYGVHPDLDDCWERKVGVDLDLGAMVCSMLRSQGIPTQLIMQLVDGVEAPVWVVAFIGDETLMFNPAAEVKLLGGIEVTLADLTVSDNAIF